MPAAIRWNLHDTPNPAERSVSLIALQREIAEKTAQFDAYVRGSLFSDFPLLADQKLTELFGNYVYTECTGNDAETLRFWFGKPKTTIEANTPFRTTTWFGNHRWPPILLAVAVIADYGAPRSFSRISGNSVVPAIGPTYYDRVAYIPDVAEGTRFVKDEFVSSAPFVIPQTPVPVPTSVDYLLPGGVGRSFPECLHPKIEIPATSTATAELVAGSASSIGKSLEGQFFPATNFEEWAPYVLSDTQEMRNGVWYRVRIRVFPPGQPDAIVSQ